MGIYMPHAALPAHHAELLVWRVLAALPLTADRIAELLSLTRFQFDPFTAQPTTMPYPVRLGLAALSVAARTPASVRAGLALEADTRLELDRSGVALRSRLAGLSPDAIEREWNAFYASPLQRHPGLPPMTVTEQAEGLGLNVSELLALLALDPGEAAEPLKTP